MDRTHPEHIVIKYDKKKRFAPNVILIVTEIENVFLHHSACKCMFHVQKTLRFRFLCCYVAKSQSLHR